MNIKDIMKQAHDTASVNGFWDLECEDESVVGAQLMLVVSELAEAMEEVRVVGAHRLELSRYVEGKPEGFPSEMADVVIRVANICEHFGVDLEGAISEKLAYNQLRSYRHGGKKL